MTPDVAEQLYGNCKFVDPLFSDYEAPYYLKSGLLSAGKALKTGGGMDNQESLRIARINCRFGHPSSCPDAPMIADK